MLWKGEISKRGATRRSRWRLLVASAPLTVLLFVSRAFAVRCTLASEAVLFGRHFVVGPSCDPTRASIILSTAYKGPNSPEPQ